MAKRKSPSRSRSVDPVTLIEAALKKQTKSELLALLLEACREHDQLRREVEASLSIEKPVDSLVADLKAAISRATDFDERMVNHNFDIDWQAYAEVERGFKKLIQLGEFAAVSQLAIRLMKEGSYQVECSDEGLMTDDIESCLKPVIRAVKKAAPETVREWAAQMIAADRVGFICEQELRTLAGEKK
jgi:hypothetical protein